MLALRKLKYQPIHNYVFTITKVSAIILLISYPSRGQGGMYII
jgi:hypothetical protein